MILSLLVIERRRICTILFKIFVFFHLASGLKINSLKSKLVGIRVTQDLVIKMANNIGCASLKIPFSYLGLVVGGSTNRQARGRMF